MSDVPAEYGRGMEPLGLVAWRDALAGGPAIPSGAELAEWSDLLASAGRDEPAALLADVAALHGGFSQQAQADRERGTGVARPFGAGAPIAGDDMWTGATADLRRLGQAIGARGVPAPTDVAQDPSDITRTARRMPSRRARWPGRALRRRGDAPAFLAAAAGLIDFALRTRDLWAGPLGTPALLHRAARLDDGGLGPYCRNVGRLARDSRDVTAMARVVQGAAGGATALAPLIALLSRGCDGGLLREVIDDLGDAAAGDALLAILDREASRSPSAIDMGLLMRIRDAGLDNADFTVAAQAQRVIARLRPDSDLEAMILGTIEASGGRRALAAALFRHRLARSPGHAELRERLEALEAGRFERFTLTRGFGSPAHRQAKRLARRGARPDGARRRGERISAVDVGVGTGETATPGKPG